MNRVGDTLQHTGANEELIKAFVNFGVDFVLIGGLAVSWYCADRQADDMDLLIDSSYENSERICNALTSLRYHGFNSDSFTKSGLRVPLKKHFYAELLTTKVEDQSYADVSATSVAAKLFNIRIKLASIVSLLEMKKNAVSSAESQRDKHQKDIECLKKLVI